MAGPGVGTDDGGGVEVAEGDNVEVFGGLGWGGHC